MKTKKTFDCVQMKNDIQESLYRQRKDTSPADVRAAMDQHLKTSAAPIAKWWRKLEKTSSQSSRTVPLH